MRKIILGLLSCFILTTNVAADEVCDNSCQTQLITAYYKGIDNILAKGSTADDIEQFLNSLHADVNYLHPEYQADFDKAGWRNAFTGTMRKGGFNNPKEAFALVKKIIHGHNYAAVEKVDRFFNVKTGKVIETPPRLAIFSFKDKKIIYIRDHWYHAAE